jgi:PTH1 family peptidyl-tRNA hydrolase
MRLVIGIGNPGAAYANTRHNLGFLVLDELARRHQLASWSKRWGSQVADWPLAPGGGTVALIKPQTFVNGSGEAVQAAAAFYKLPLAELLVVVDDINLALGTLRLRASGSAGGHNGLRDIEARLGPGYPRLRLGIGQPAQGASAQIGHVLGRFAADEQEPLRAMIARAADCVESWCAGGLEGAARFNGAGAPAPAPRPAPAPGAGTRPAAGATPAPRPPDPAI